MTIPDIKTMRGNCTILRLFITLVSLAVSAHAGMNNTLYVEFGGNAGMYSINYDRNLFTVAERHTIGCRAGISWLPFQVDNIQNACVFPVMANYLFGKGQSKLEIGMGVTTLLYTDKYWNFVDLSATFACGIGYRFQQMGSGTNIRVALTPIFFGGFRPWLGLSLGRSF